MVMFMYVYLAMQLHSVVQLLTMQIPPPATRGRSESTCRELAGEIFLMFLHGKDDKQAEHSDIQLTVNC